MANEMDAATEYAVLIPEIWSTKLHEARYAASVIAPRVSHFDVDVAKYGNKVNIPIEPAITIGDVTATTGALANQALTYTESELSIDQWRGAKIQVVDQAEIQSKLKSVMPQFVKSGGKALAYDIDDALAALFDGFSTTVGSAGDSLTPELMLAAMQEMINDNIPLNVPDDVSFIFHTSKWSQYHNIDKFFRADYTGTKGGYIEYKAPAPFGVPIFFSTGVDLSTTYKNALIHKEALALGVQKKIMIEKDRSDFSTTLALANMYGVKELRDDHGIEINTD